jgi:hypothetical protein
VISMMDVNICLTNTLRSGVPFSVPTSFGRWRIISAYK